MSDFDRIYDHVREMNRDWNRTVQNIRDGRPELSDRLYRLEITGADTRFGTVEIDGRGILRSIDLDAHRAAGVYEADVIGSVIIAANAALERARSADGAGGDR